jgi:chromosome segregation ATPase
MINLAAIAKAEARQNEFDQYKAQLAKLNIDGAELDELIKDTKR